MPTAHQPRFDFGSNLDPMDEQTATLGELLEELNYESTYKPNGERANSSRAGAVDIREKNLELTLDFIRHALGEEIHGKTDLLPLSTVKTVKLLYTKNDSSDAQLFRRLARPNDTNATMEHWNARKSVRNEDTIKFASEIMDTISRELNPIMAWHINTALVTTSQLLERIEDENFAILEPIYCRHLGNDDALYQAFRNMAELVASYTPAQDLQGGRVAPLHERLYVYLRTLPFYHFIGEYKRLIQEEEALLTQGDEPPQIVLQPILDSAGDLCNDISQSMGRHIDIGTPITSIAKFPDFLTHHALALSKILHHATGIKSERRDLLGINDEALNVLHTYVFHQWHRTDAKEVNLSLSDCIAALATVRIQQKVKTPYQPKWVGQESSDMTVTRLLTHLNSTRSIEELYEEDYIPQGALHILYHRFCIVHARISGHHQGRLQAWMDFQIERHAQYAECFRSNNIVHINRATNNLHHFCRESAHRVLSSIKMKTVQFSTELRPYLWRWSVNDIKAGSSQ